MQPRLRKILTHKYLLISMTVLLFYSLVGFVAIPMAIRWYLPTFAEQHLQSRATVESFHLNPFLLTVDLRGFRLQQVNGEPLASFSRLFIDLETSSVFRLALVLRTVELDQPDIHLVMGTDGITNFQRLLPSSASEQEQTTGTSPLLPFLLEHAAIQEGQLIAIDQRQSVPAHLVLQNINLQATALSSLSDQEGHYQWAMATKEGGAFQGDGTISLTPFRTSGKVGLSRLSLATLWHFIRDNTHLEEPAGQLDFSTTYTIDMGSTPNQMTLAATQFSLDGLALRLHKGQTDLVTLKQCMLDVPKIDLGTREIQVKNFLLENGAIDVRINESGVINLQQVLREPTPKDSPQYAIVPAAAPTDNHAIQKEVPVAASPPTDTPFKVGLESINVQGIAIKLDDLSRKSPLKAEIAGINLHLQSRMEVGAGKNRIVFQRVGTELKGVSLHNAPAGAPLFAADQIVVENGACDLAAQSLTIDRVALSKGRLDAGRDPQGNLNWQQILEPKIQPPVNAKSATPPAKGTAWKFLVKTFEMNGFTSQFTDLTTPAKKPVMSLKNITSRCTNIDGKSPMDFSIGLQMEQGGTATIKGKIDPKLPSVDASLQASNLALTSLQPYLEPHARLLLQSAAVTTQGRLQYGVAGKKYQTGYEGSFNLNDFLLVYSDAPQKPYLGWKAVQIPQFLLTLEPNRFEAREITLVKPMGELIIEEDKSLNVTKVLIEPATADKSAKPDKPAEKKTAEKKEQQDFPFQISKVRVEDGNMVFADLGLLPKFMTRIHDLKGTVTGLSSAKDAQTSIQLDGRVDRFGTAKIKGQVTTNDFPRASTIDMDFRNLEMKNLSPYSGRFAGRLIKSGKISATLQYTLRDYKMIGDNKIVIDKLSLGDKVKAAESANLPLDLAIALLQDSSGRIDIGLPVSGDLNDPEFSIGALLWKAFTNLITKVATSPFRMLGGLLGSGEENFDAVVFDHGRADLLPPEKEKLLRLTDALKTRPQLKLVLQGRYSAEADGNELQQRAIRAQVARKLGLKPGPNELNEPLDFNDADTQDALEELFKERFGKKALEELEQGITAGTITPRMPAAPQPTTKKETGFFSRITESIRLDNIIPGGLSREQATMLSGELFTRLAAGETVADTTLLQLADNRAQAVAALLRDEGRIAADRFQIITPEPLGEDEPPSTTLSLEAL